MIASSIKPGVIFRTRSHSRGVGLENYSHGWNALLHPFSHYLINSFIIVLGSVLGNLVSCSLAAYAFARLNFRFRGLWFAIMLMSIMLPIHVIIVPNMFCSPSSGINTFLPLIVPSSSLQCVLRVPHGPVLSRHSPGLDERRVLTAQGTANLLQVICR